jgi:hypothetical protein
MHGLSQEESHELAALLQTLSYCIDYRLEAKSSTYTVVDDGKKVKHRHIFTPDRQKFRAMCEEAERQAHDLVMQTSK